VGCEPLKKLDLGSIKFMISDATMLAANRKKKERELN
jgi:hypothetical protein